MSGYEELDTETLLGLYDRDVFVFSGPIFDEEAMRFTEVLVGGKRRKRAALILTTFGGDLHSAFRIARTLKRHYEDFLLMVSGTCASAGTLIALAASELSFGPFGELGPLDIQVRKPDDIVPQFRSGLDTTEAFASLSNRAFAAFETSMLKIVRKSYGAISTKVAAELSIDLVRALVEPIAAQIDPYRMAEADRLMRVATHYAKAIESENVRIGGAESLARSYPNHAFIIDQEEASTIFHQVRTWNEIELEIVMRVGHCVFTPQREAVIDTFAGVAGGNGANETENENDSNENEQEADDRELPVPGKSAGSISTSSRPGRRSRPAQKPSVSRDEDGGDKDSSGRKED
jgi:hypothetical protein